MKNKLVKVTINGRRQSDIDLHRTKWGLFKFKVKRLFKRLFFLTGIAVIVVSVFQLGSIFNPVFSYQTVEREIIVDNLTKKIEELKDGILDDIKKGESVGKPESAGLIVFDTNQKASIGSYQFQIKTIVHYYKKLYGKTITNKEAILIALDDQEARNLAKDIIFKEKGGWRNWFNVSTRYNVEQRLQVIDNLEK